MSLELNSYVVPNTQSCNFISNLSFAKRIACASQSTRRRLCKVWHPHLGTPEEREERTGKIQEINAAYAHASAAYRQEEMREKARQHNRPEATQQVTQTLRPWMKVSSKPSSGSSRTMVWRSRSAGCGFRSMAKRNRIARN